MSTQPAKNRPLSPFMIGPYYKPQLTSMLSITHRATGVGLCGGALLLAWWMAATAAGPEAYERFAAFARHPLGIALGVAMIFSLLFHWFNGIRHLLWDAGWGFELPRTYATGWAVLVLSVLGTAVASWCVYGGGGA